MSSGAYVMDHDGSTLYNTGISHGDRHRTSDIDPERPGLETFSIQQYAPDMLGMILYDAATGEPIKKWYLPALGDVGRGECLDLDPMHLGWEMFSTMDDYQIYDSKGNKIDGKKGYFPTEGLWWDGELDRENVNSPDGNGYNAMIVDYKSGRLIEMTKESNWTVLSSSGKRGKFWGDIIGDWREELILIRERGGVCEGIVGFTTDYKTDINNIYCLQQDPHYRGDCTTRGYYQTPCPAFYLGYDMPRPQLPPCMPGTLTQSTAVEADTVLISLQSPADVTIGRADVVYAMPVKGQTVTMHYDRLNADAQIWKGQLGTLDIASPLACHIYITEGTVRGSTLSGIVDLRACGTLTAAYVDSLTVEGALNYEGCRLIPQGDMTVNRTLTIAEKQKLYVELMPGKDCLTLNRGIDLKGSLIFTLPDDLAAGTYTLLKGCPGLDIKHIDVRGLTGKSYSLGLQTTDGIVALYITVIEQRKAAEGVVWTGAVNNTWDYLTENFTLGDRPTTFIEGDGVIFDDTAVNTSITINDMMPVTTATFAGVDKDYVIGDNGGISGRTILQSGKLTVKELNYDFEIGRATLVVNSTNASDERPVLLTDTATISVPSGTVALKGRVTGEGVLVKDGKGQLNITYPGANKWTGTILRTGTLAMGAWNTTIGSSTSPIHVTGDATLVVFNNNSSSEMPNLQNVITIDRDVTLTLHAGKRCNIKGTLKGEGTLKIDFPYVRGDVYTNTSHFEGTYQVTTENCRFVQSMDLSHATLQLDKGSAAVSMKAGSGTEQNLNHKVGTLTGQGTLGNGTWTIAALRYNAGPTIITGNVKMSSPLIDVTELCTGRLADNAELKVLTVKGNVSIDGAPLINPPVPKDGWLWDTTELASDGILRIVPAPDGIESICIDDLGDAVIYDLSGRRVITPSTGIYVVDGVKKLIKATNTF